MAETPKTTEVAEKKPTFKESLTTDLVSVQDGLPKDFNVTRFVSNAVAMLNDNQQLQDFAKKNGTAQIKAGLMKSAYLGLDAINKECYLIPYGNTLNFMVDYRGNVKLCKKYSIRPIKDIYAKLVREGDEFSEEIVNGEPSINFKPKPFNDGKIQGAFAVCLFADGGMIYDTMSLADLENTRKSSKASNSPAWTKFAGQMYLKTVLHRLCKMIELDFDSSEQRMYFDEDMAIETDEKQIVRNEVSSDANSEDFVDAEAVVIESDDNA